MFGGYLFKVSVNQVEPVLGNLKTTKESFLRRESEGRKDRWTGGNERLRVRDWQIGRVDPNEHKDCEQSPQDQWQLVIPKHPLRDTHQPYPHIQRS